MTIKALMTAPEEGKIDMLEVLELMKRAIEEGEIVSFIAVGIAPNDETLMWIGSQKRVTRLRMMGAISNLQHQFASEEF